MERSWPLFSLMPARNLFTVNKTLPFAQRVLELRNTHQNGKKWLFRNEKRDKNQIKVGNTPLEELDRVGKQKEMGMKSYKWSLSLVNEEIYNTNSGTFWKILGTNS